eukprot:365883-Chlamydomonas_euryale.AAC.7
MGAPAAAWLPGISASREGRGAGGDSHDGEAFVWLVGGMHSFIRFGGSGGGGAWVAIRGCPFPYVHRGHWRLCRRADRGEPAQSPGVVLTHTPTHRHRPFAGWTATAAAVAHDLAAGHGYSPVRRAQVDEEVQWVKGLLGS